MDDEPAERVERFTEGVTPGRQIGVALREKTPDEALKNLSERRIGDVALVLAKFSGSKDTVARDERLVQLVDDGGLADAGISRDQDQLRRAAPDDAIERGEQGFDLALSPVQQLWNQEAVRIVVLAEAEVFDPALLFPCGKAALKIALEAGRGLIAFLRRLGGE